MSSRNRRKRSRKNSYGPVILVSGICFALLIVGVVVWVVAKRGHAAGDRAKLDLFGSGGSSTSDLSAAVAETDKLDPRWRLADLVKARAKLDPDRNSARLALSAARQVPENALNVALDVHEPRGDLSRPVPEFELQRLRPFLRSYGTAVNEARAMADFSAGQFEINVNFESPLDTKLEPETLARKTAGLLLCDTRLRAAEGDGSGAVRSTSALLILARCYNDEPFLIGYLVRIAINTIAVDALEQTLSCATVSDSDLKSLQGLLEGQASETLLIALRGERAVIHATIEAKTGAGAGVSQSSHAWFLRTMNKAIDLAGKGLPYYSAEWTSYLDSWRNGPEDGKRIAPGVDKIRDASARQAAILRTSAVAVAAERYRRASGSWPTDLKQLVPNYISSLPTDPYTGNPIQSAQVAQGFSVYVKGLSAFASGEFSAIGSKPDNCQGLRLLNPNLRHGGRAN
jgi:hypothetical protein